MSPLLFLVFGIAAGGMYAGIFTHVQVRLFNRGKGRLAAVLFPLRHGRLFLVFVLVAQRASGDVLVFFSGFVVAFFSILSIVAFKTPGNNEERQS